MSRDDVEAGDTCCRLVASGGLGILLETGNVVGGQVEDLEIEILGGGFEDSRLGACDGEVTEIEQLGVGEGDTWRGSGGQEVPVVARGHSQGLVSSQSSEVLQEGLEAKAVHGGVAG